MKANGQMEQVTEDTYMPCDYCHKDMKFSEYSTHNCEGLYGLNPLDEKLKNAKWKVPADVRARGNVLNAPVTPSSFFEARKKRRARLLVRSALAVIFLVGLLAGYLIR